MQKTRKLKVGYSPHRLANGSVKFNPKLLLQGKYLQEMGYQIDQSVEIICENDCIIIRKIS